ncbi:GNAT family N-acetyltransferase [Chromobacterium haemolyticum]|uniref:GNAT family N-acetyltransferase n=1 Tax=Chromobacterium fluminis TaxID=3044269 RepID=A0ABX0LG26_9NEIS|nr:GNAT family N-acetyltransferase [Chromobacterium haemolyticum]NHR07893.1 GNAT family N-acetyltransferase [Chromobacterium haemolyticum]
MSFDFVFVPVIGTEDVQLERFSCGNEPLDQFLKQEARDYAEHGITTTTVVWVEGDMASPAAFFSLSNDVVRLTGGETGELGLPFLPVTNNFPAVKLTKFAVAQAYQRTGLGRELMKYIEGMVFVAKGMSAVRLLTLDSLPEDHVLNFYASNGFMRCEHEDRQRRHQRRRQTIPMFKDLYVAP